MAIRTSAAEVDLCSSLVFPAIHSISPRTNDEESTQDITIAVHSRGVCPEDMKMITIITQHWWSGYENDKEDIKMIKRRWRIWKLFRGYIEDMKMM